eukprot:PhF_6_TR32932/c0_g1_i1/m.48398
MNVFIFACLIFVVTADSSWPTLHVACRKGQAPFIDAEFNERTGIFTCSGVLYDLWREVENRLKLTSKITYFNGSSDELFNSLTYTSTHNTTYDIALTFSSVLSSRMSNFDFSVTIAESEYTVALLPSFRKHGSSFASALVRPSVMHLFYVVLLIATANVVIFMVFETAAYNSELLDKPFFVKVFTVLIGSLDITLFGATSVFPLKSFVSKVVRMINSLARFFLLNLFASAITAQLTASQMHSSVLTIDDCYGKKLVSSSSSLKDFLQSPRINAIQITSSAIFNDYDNFFSKGNPDGIDGIVSAEAITSYYYEHYNAAAMGYVITQNFLVTGMKDLRAFIMSRGIPTSLRDAINVELAKLREEGFIGNMYRLHVHAPGTPASETDIDIAQADVRVVRLTAIICFVGLFCIIFASMLVHMYSKYRTTQKLTELLSPHNHNRLKHVDGVFRNWDSVDLTRRTVMCWNGREYHAFPQ